MIHVGDNTWNLRVFITDLQVEKTLRVRGDLHIGGVMLRLVDPGEFRTKTKNPMQSSIYSWRIRNCLWHFHRHSLHSVHWNDARYSSNANGLNIKAAHDFQFAELVVGWFKVVSSQRLLVRIEYIMNFAQLSSFIPSAQAATTTTAVAKTIFENAMRLHIKIKYAVYFNFDLVWSYKVLRLRRWLAEMCFFSPRFFLSLQYEKQRNEVKKIQYYQHSKQ